jgi:predicted enzyme related to lactoylglutathione lyase
LTRLIYNMQPSLMARDMRKTIDFYTKLLGFTLDASEPEDEPTWCAMHSGNARMMWTALEPSFDAPAVTGRIYFYPDDVDAAWEAIKDHAQVVETPHVTDYEMREFSIRDPNGYLLAFGNSAGEHEHDEHGNHI